LISSQERPKSKHISAGADKPALIERQIESVKLRPASFIVTTGRNSCRSFHQLLTVFALRAQRRSAHARTSISTVFPPIRVWRSSTVRRTYLT
jgi:hypothetical protein